VAPAKQEIADGPNQGRRAYTHSGHFIGSNVVTLVASQGIIRSNKNNQAG
jgi:hypothetical protein